MRHCVFLEQTQQDEHGHSIACFRYGQILNRTIFFVRLIFPTGKMRPQSILHAAIAYL